MTGWFCFFASVSVAFSHACEAVWDPSGAVALLLWGVSAEGASGCGAFKIQDVLSGQSQALS